MEKNKSWKKAAAFAVALTMVCSNIPAQLGQTGLLGGSVLTASAQKEQEPVNEVFSIIVDEFIEDGEVTVDKQEASEGDEVIVTATPSSGLAVKSVTINGEQMAVNDQGKYVFSMPAEDVLVSAEFAKEYSITVDDSVENGTVEVDKTKAFYEDAVTVTPKADEGYAVRSVKLNDEQMAVNDEGEYVFEMPENDVTVSAEFAQEHTITVAQNIENGSISVDKNKAISQDEITIIPAPAKGYVVKAITINGEQMAVNDKGEYVFEMPDNDVTVSAEFELSKYTITVDDNILNGSVSLNKEAAAVGEAVTVTPTAQEGYAVKAVTINGDQMAVNDKGKYVFIMPESDVTVSAEFEKQYIVKGDPDMTNGAVYFAKADEQDTSLHEEYAAVEGDDVCLIIQPDDGYKVKAVYANGDQVAVNDEDEYVIEVSDKDITVSVEFIKETYTIRVTEPENGTVTVDKKRAEADDDITITPTADEGYEIESVSINGETVAVNDRGKYVAAMPAMDCEVAVKFAKKEFTVTVDENIKNGQLSVSENEYAWDDEVAAELTPDEGYAVKSFLVDGKEIEPNKYGVYTFSMPKKNITVSAVFEAADSELVSQFETYKQTAKTSIDSLVQQDTNPAITSTAEMLKESIDELAYNSSQTLDQNKANIDNLVEDFKTLVKEIKEHSEHLKDFQDYLDTKCREITDLIEEDDSEQTKSFIYSLQDKIESVVYDRTKTYDENKKVVDDIAAQCKKDIAAKREYEKNFEQFNTYAIDQKDHLNSLAQDDDSAASKAIIDNAAKQLDALDYNDKLTLDENKLAVNDIVEKAERALEQQRANDKLSANVRVFGNNRYDTSIEAAKKFMQDNKLEKLPALVIATGSDYADALSAAYLAKVKGAPIILTNTSAEPIMKTTLDFIHKNCDKNTQIYLIGGQGAISLHFQKRLTSSAFIDQQYKVKRIEGKNRYLTNIAILKEAGVTDEELVIASGKDFADAISASSSARPMLLVAGNKLTAEQEAFVKGLKSSKAYIAGGTSAVSADIEKQIKGLLKNVVRLGGKNRYETSALIAEQFCPKSDVIALAYGLSFPDGISGAPLAMQYGAPIVLATDKAVKEAAAYAKKAGVNRYVVFGGRSLISDVSAKSIAKAK